MFDLMGQTFGRLTVIEFAGHFPRKTGKVRAWRCVCTCTTKTIVSTGDLRHGRIQSCGCLRSDNIYQRNIKKEGK